MSDRSINLNQVDSTAPENIEKLEDAKELELVMHSRIDMRYQLSCQALCRWPTADECLQNTVGKTRDISIHGVFVLADLCPTLGTEIELRVLLPNQEGTGVGIRLHGKGPVLRVEQSSTTGASGFAASVQFLQTYPTATFREEEELGEMQC
jgi:hypothetical protein